MVDEGEKPKCGSRQSGWYDTVAHIFALLLILTLSTLACGLPLISRRTTTGKRQRTIIFYCQHVGTGVLLATAFVHLLPTAFESLTDPCLPHFFSKGYKPLPGLVAMVSAIIVVGVESYLTARGAGHSHSHAHGLFDESDEASSSDGHFHDVDLNDDNAGSQSVARARGHPPADISLDDMEATQGLVAGVSPLPESTPVATPRIRKSTDREFDDGDSDLELDMDELDPAPANDARNGPYASLKPNGLTRRDTDSGLPPQTPEEQQRQLLQCLLLEAGILFHSVFIGMAISVATGPAFIVFLVAISFHQSFEGLALGSRIAAIQFPRGSIRPWLMVLAYGVTTPLGQAIGLAVHTMYDPASMGGLLVVGFMNAISSGLLLYAGLVQLLAEDFLTEKSYKVLKGRKRLHAYLAVCGGAVLMALVWFSLLVTTAAFWGTAVVKRSPYSYETTPPVRQWADHPMKLVSVPTALTPQQQAAGAKDDLLTTAAQHMALVHNSLIRGYNSIFLQAPHVAGHDDGEEDLAAHFVGYAQTWVKFLKGHHDDEEAVLFPEMVSMLQDETLWTDMYKEHESFLGDLDALDAHLTHLSANASAYQPGPLLKLLDALRAPVEQHLHHEVTLLASLATHPRAPARDSFSGAVAAETLRAWGKNSVRGPLDVVPFFLLNADRDADGGRWAAWPPMPRAVRWALVNAAGAVHGGRWRFASCDAAGRPRELFAVQRAADRRRREQEGMGKDGDDKGKAEL
ncbi:maintenance of telomere capping protein 1 [Purpureocillium lavendulum]|uniref:Maintenance of telomere capping protein 1 n=1 Tax=Purpureocillium lavendulum TaxID=1247861 RepID=A0AB34FUM7_9HYPO|nr:maintenance of telomere capping protein 1 [Purpureocillium lavendulum]